MKISAQPTHITWENIQPAYESFADIKPQIVNENEKSVFLIDSGANFVVLQVFDKQNQEWNYSKYKAPDIDSFGRKYRNRKLKSKQRLDLTREIAWNYMLLGQCFPCDGIPSWEDMLEYSEGRKYKLVIYYRKSRNSDPLKSESPEFWVKPKNT